MNGREPGLPLEDFIQAITSQLDRTQEAMALKAQAGLPLTFAVKDLSLDLRTHVDMTGSVVRIRPAGPGDVEASTIHLSLSTITRPMIEENTRSAGALAGETSLREALGDELSEEDERRLEWAGVRSVEQLRALRAQRAENAINRATRLPVQRLFSRLQEASRPAIHEVTRLEPAEPPVMPGRPSRLRIRGRNFLPANEQPRVRLRGEPVEVLELGHDELIVAPTAAQLGGPLEVETSEGVDTVELADEPGPIPDATRSPEAS